MTVFTNRALTHNDVCTACGIRLVPLAEALLR